MSTVISDDSDDDLNTETCNEAKQVNELLLAMQQCEEQLNVHAKSFNQATPVKMSKSEFSVSINPTVNEIFLATTVVELV